MLIEMENQIITSDEKSEDNELCSNMICLSTMETDRESNPSVISDEDKHYDDEEEDEPVRITILDKNTDMPAEYNHLLAVVEEPVCAANTF